MKLRIVVADDNLEFLDVVVSMLRIEFEVVATAADGKAALKCICRRLTSPSWISQCQHLTA